jgi:hypothetical protein
MSSLRTKAGPEEILESVTDSLSAVRGSAHRQTLLKAVLIAGGVAALTAGSAAISSLRRRVEPTS